MYHFLFFFIFWDSSCLWDLFIECVSAADQTKGMQDQFSGAAMGMPQDASKAFKVSCIFDKKATGKWI